VAVVHDEHRVGILRGDPLGGVLLVAADDDPVRVQEVVHRGALAQELRVAHHRDIPAVQQLQRGLRCADGHRRLVDDHATRREQVPDLGRHGSHGGQVGGTALAHRRGHAEEHHLDRLAVAARHRVPRAHHELQSPRGLVLGDELGQPRLKDVDDAAAQPLDLHLVDIRADDAMAERG
jgi:hypothetical protein